MPFSFLFIWLCMALPGMIAFDSHKMTTYTNQNAIIIIILTLDMCALSTIMEEFQSG
jgi:hypothetical protein